MSVIEAALDISSLPQDAEVTQSCCVEREETLWKCCCGLWKLILSWERGHG